MISASALLVPVIKGFSAILGGSALASGTYIVYKKSLKNYPLTPYLEKVSEKKFSRKSQVSRHNKGNGITTYKYKIPAGYSVYEMNKLKEGIENKFDCEVQVWAEEKKFVIELSTNSIPKELNFNKEEIKNILSNYEFAMYLGKSRKGHSVIDFTENATPHLLFGGPTGGGKSNMLNQGICGMLEAYSSNEMNLYLIDMKDGVELGPYESIKHVKGFYETFGQVDKGLNSILLELKSRNELFKEKGVKKLSQYNKVSSPLPRILIIADEFAQFNNIADKELKKSIISKWEEILQKGRSTGIHVCIGTQVADADVFPKQIKGNIDARFGFKFTDVQHSKMISGGSELTTLPNIIGRGLFKLGTYLTQIQVPYLKESDLEEILKTHVREEKENVSKIIKETVDIEEPKERMEPDEEITDVSEPNSIEDLFIAEEDLKPSTSL